MKIKIETIWKVIPVLFFENKNLKPAGRSYGIAVALKDLEKASEELIQHELVHIKQFYRTLGLHVLLYRFYEKYRYKSEIEAYRMTIKIGKYSYEEASWIPRGIRKDKMIKHRSDYQIMKDLFY